MGDSATPPMRPANTPQGGTSQSPPKATNPREGPWQREFLRSFGRRATAGSLRRRRDAPADAENWSPGWDPSAEPRGWLCAPGFGLPICSSLLGTESRNQVGDLGCHLRSLVCGERAQLHSWQQLPMEPRRWGPSPGRAASAWDPDHDPGIWRIGLGRWRGGGQAVG